jgi:hypothetical protein
MPAETASAIFTLAAAEVYFSHDAFAVQISWSFTHRTDEFVPGHAVKTLVAFEEICKSVEQIPARWTLTGAV